MTDLYAEHPIDSRSTVAMQIEVAAVNRANGWYDNDRSILEGAALLHSEVSEALEAYREWGTDDLTAPAEGLPAGALPKPEGFGAELADVLIRLLDETDRHGITLVRSVMVAGSVADASVGDCMGMLHRDLSRLADTDMAGSSAAAVLYGRLVAVADKYGIDLLAEYDRKLAYNATRGHRHGNKRL